MSEMFPSFSSNFLHCPKFRVKNMAEGRQILGHNGHGHRHCHRQNCSFKNQLVRVVAQINFYYQFVLHFVSRKTQVFSSSFDKFASLLEPCSKYISLEFFYNPDIFIHELTSVLHCRFISVSAGVGPNHLRYGPVLVADM